MTYSELANYMEELNLTNPQIECRCQTEPFNELKVYHGKLVQRIQPEKGDKARLKEEVDGKPRSWYYIDIQKYHDYLEEMKWVIKPVTFQKYLGLKATYYHETHQRKGGRNENEH